MYEFVCVNYYTGMESCSIGGIGGRSSTVRAWACVGAVWVCCGACVDAVVSLLLVCGFFCGCSGVRGVDEGQCCGG